MAIPPRKLSVSALCVSVALLGAPAAFAEEPLAVEPGEAPETDTEAAPVEPTPGAPAPVEMAPVETAPVDTVGADGSSAAPTEEVAAPEEEGEDFLQDLSRGLSLEDLGVQVSWSGYGDASVIVLPWDQASFLVGHFNLIPVARLSEEVWTEMEIEVHETLSLEVEYATINYAPFPWLSFRAGKLLLPIGRYNRELHPSFRWEQVAPPSMMTEVVPVAWADVGLEVGGSVDVGEWLTFSYSVFVANGMSLSATQETSKRLDEVLPLPVIEKPGEHGADPGAHDETAGHDEAPAPTTGGDAHGGGDDHGAGVGAEDFSHGAAHLEGPMQEMSATAGLIDNNLDKAIGGRLGVSLFPGAFGHTVLGVSAYTAAPDAASRYRITLIDVDAEMRFDSFLLRGEIAQSFLSDYLGTKRQYLETGGYLQGVFTYGFLRLAARGDFVVTRPDFGAYVWNTAFTPTVTFIPFTYMNVRGEVIFPFDQELNMGTPTFLGMLAFMF